MRSRSQGGLSAEAVGVVENAGSSSGRGRTGGGASGAGEPTLAGEAQFERGMMALGTDGGFHVLDKRIPHPLQLSGCRVRSPGRVARNCANEQLGLIDLHQVKEPQVDSQLALLAELGSAELLLAVECFKPALETGRVLASALRATVLLLQLGSQVAVVAADAFELPGQPVP